MIFFCSFVLFIVVSVAFCDTQVYLNVSKCGMHMLSDILASMIEEGKCEAAQDRRKLCSKEGPEQKGKF